MLLQSCLGWRDQMHIVLLCETCLVNVRTCAGSVIQQDNEPIDGVYDIFWYVTWCRGQLQQCVCEFWQHGPDCPGCLLTMPSKTGHSVTPSQSVEHWQCPCLLRSQAICYLLVCQVPELLPVPNTSHNSSSGCSPWAIDTSNTTTLVSTVRIIILWWPCWAAWNACSNMRLSASS